jgi:hypothetical protein
MRASLALPLCGQAGRCVLSLEAHLTSASAWVWASLERQQGADLSCVVDECDFIEVAGGLFAAMTVLGACLTPRFGCAPWPTLTSAPICASLSL